MHRFHKSEVNIYSVLGTRKKLVGLLLSTSVTMFITYSSIPQAA